MGSKSNLLRVLAANGVGTADGGVPNLVPTGPAGVRRKYGSCGSLRTAAVEVTRSIHALLLRQNLALQTVFTSDS